MRLAFRSIGLRLFSVQWANRVRRRYKVDGVGPTQLIEPVPIFVNSSEYLVLKAQIRLDKTVLRKR